MKYGKWISKIKDAPALALKNCTFLAPMAPTLMRSHTSDPTLTSFTFFQIANGKLNTYFHYSIFIVEALSGSLNMRKCHTGFFDPRFISLHYSCDLGVKWGFKRGKIFQGIDFSWFRALLFSQNWKIFKNIQNWAKKCLFWVVF